MIYVIGSKDSVPVGATRIDTTSRSINWSRQLSPFLLGPVKLYGVFRTAIKYSIWQSYLLSFLTKR